MERTQLLVPVSVGELLDKITILQIKVERITEERKLSNIRKELAALLEICRQSRIDTTHQLVRELKQINESLWVIEDDIRDKERAKEFDARFIELARAVYVTNDRRFQVKAQVNQLMGSDYEEEKSYQPY